jgi:hypothetical protein
MCRPSGAGDLDAVVPGLTPWAKVCRASGALASGWRVHFWGLARQCDAHLLTVGSTEETPAPGWPSPLSKATQEWLVRLECATRRCPLSHRLLDRAFG